MYNFIVGGYLPFTNIQISLQAYMALVAVVGGGVWLGRTELRRRALVRPPRVPLPANQLHLRAL